MSREFSGRMVAVAGGVAGLLAISGCGVITGAMKPDTSEAVIKVSPGTKGERAPASSPVKVEVANGRLTQVKVIGPKGDVAGSMNSDGTVWTSKQRWLAFGADYQVEAQAVDDSGVAAETAASFKTVKPTDTIEGEFTYFSKGQTVGVGMPGRIVFSRAVSKKRLKDVEKRLVVTSSKPIVGAWSWDWDRKGVTFRPKKYWPAKTKVEFHARIRGVETSPGVYATGDINSKFRVGSSMISTINAASYSMKVKKNGKVVQVIPVTTGKAGFETRSGIKLIIAKEGTIIMDAATGGTPVDSPEYYRLTVAYAMRVTPSGEFLHAAPWSTGAQGNSNVSHGCIGMSTGNAIWMYNNSKVGDVVIVKNTGRKQDLGNGITQWNVPWKKWLKRSKVGAQEIGPEKLAAASTSTAGPSA